MKCPPPERTSRESDANSPIFAEIYTILVVLSRQPCKDAIFLEQYLTENRTVGVRPTWRFYFGGGAGPLTASLGPGDYGYSKGPLQAASPREVAGPLRHCGARGSLPPYPLSTALGGRTSLLLPPPQAPKNLVTPLRRGRDRGVVLSDDDGPSSTSARIVLQVRSRRSAAATIVPRERVQGDVDSLSGWRVDQPRTRSQSHAGLHRRHARQEPRVRTQRLSSV